MTHLQKHLNGKRISGFKKHKETTSKDEGNGNPYSLERMSESISRLVPLSTSGISRMLKARNRWPKLNTAVALADFLDIRPDMVFELARKDMEVEMQQGATK